MRTIKTKPYVPVLNVLTGDRLSIEGGNVVQLGASLKKFILIQGSSFYTFDNYSNVKNSGISGRLIVMGDFSGQLDIISNITDYIIFGNVSMQSGVGGTITDAGRNNLNATIRVFGNIYRGGTTGANTAAGIGLLDGCMYFTGNNNKISIDFNRCEGSNFPCITINGGSGLFLQTNGFLFSTTKIYTSNNVNNTIGANWWYHTGEYMSYGAAIEANNSSANYTVITLSGSMAKPKYFDITSDHRTAFGYSVTGGIVCSGLVNLTIQDLEVKCNSASAVQINVTSRAVFRKVKFVSSANASTVPQVCLLNASNMVLDDCRIISTTGQACMASISPSTFSPKVIGGLYANTAIASGTTTLIDTVANGRIMIDSNFNI